MRSEIHSATESIQLPLLYTNKGSITSSLHWQQGYIMYMSTRLKDTMCHPGAESVAFLECE